MTSPDPIAAAVHPLQRYLNATGLSQAELARLSGVRQSAISQLVTGAHKVMTGESARRIMAVVRRRRVAPGTVRPRLEDLIYPWPEPDPLWGKAPHPGLASNE